MVSNAFLRSMKTPKNGVCSRWASCWASFASMIPGPVPRPARQQAATKAVVEDDPLQPNIHYPLQNLPNQFEEPDSPIFPPPFGINTVTTQHICWGAVPVAQTDEQSSTNSSHVFPFLMWLMPFSGSSANFAPRSHALMCSARIPDAPPHRPWLSWETAVQSSVCSLLQSRWRSP